MKNPFVYILSSLTFTMLFSSPLLAQVTVKTGILPEETIVKMTEFLLPPPPPGPFRFTLPMDIKIVKNDSVSSNTPLTDLYGIDKLDQWLAAIRQCLNEKTKLVRVIGNQQVPFVVNEKEGKITLNANNQPTCPTSF